MGLLFGCERFGMANEDVYRCDVALRIPSNPQFGSLNLGAAIQLVAYEWRQALGGFTDALPIAHVQRADAQQVAGMLGHWQQALEHVGFLDPAAPKKLMPRLNQLFNRAQLSPGKSTSCVELPRRCSQYSGPSTKLYGFPLACLHCS